MTLMERLAAFAQDDEGAAALEYGLCTALIAAVNVPAVESVGSALNAVLADVLDKIS